MTSERSNVSFPEMDDWHIREKKKAKDNNHAQYRNNNLIVFDGQCRLENHDRAGKPRRHQHEILSCQLKNKRLRQVRSIIIIREISLRQEDEKGKRKDWNSVRHHADVESHKRLVNLGRVREIKRNKQQNLIEMKDEIQKPHRPGLSMHDLNSRRKKTINSQKKKRKKRISLGDKHRKNSNRMQNMTNHDTLNDWHRRRKGFSSWPSGCFYLC